MDFTLERKQVHELANHLTIVQGAVKAVLKSLDQKKGQFDDEKARLEKANDYIKKSIESLRELRAHIHAKSEELGKE